MADKKADTKKTDSPKTPQKTAHGFVIPEHFQGRKVLFPYPEIGEVDFNNPSKEKMRLIHHRRKNQFKKA